MDKNDQTQKALESAQKALWAIANMLVTLDTDKGEVLDLCMSIAQVELMKDWEGGGGEDTKLIEAAPDLLKACKVAKQFLQPCLAEPGRTVFWRLVDAINKAEER